MAKYRKRPVVVEAVQWHHTTKGYSFRDIVFPNEYVAKTESDSRLCDCCQKPIKQHGKMVTRKEMKLVCPGDWIIREAAGGFSCCKPNVFKLTYESVDTPSW